MQDNHLQVQKTNFFLLIRLHLNVDMLCFACIICKLGSRRKLCQPSQRIPLLNNRLAVQSTDQCIGLLSGRGRRNN